MAGRPSLDSALSGARSRRSRPRIVVVGGGVAGLEAMLALRELLGGMVELVLVSPEADFVYAPMTVAEPFGAGEARSFALELIARDQQAELRRDALAEVDAERHLIRTLGGEAVAYDALIVAVGARRRPWLPGALTFRGRADAESLRELLSDLDAGEVGRVAFASPPGESWSLPLYELALLTAAHVADHGLIEVQMTLVTPEEAPLGVFGRAAARAVRELLSDRGIALRTGTVATSLEGEHLYLVAGDPLRVDRVVAMARLEGPAVAGLPRDPQGFIPVDSHGRVEGLEDVYAAGDGTNFPVKQGGIATQQADAVADAIAARLGAAVEPRPLRPVLRGMLLSGLGPTYLRSDISGTAGDDSDVATETLWWPPAKIAGRHLGPYLAGIQHPAPPGASSPLSDRAPTGKPTPTGSGERHVARDLALALADAEGEWGHYREALSALDAAEAIDPILPTEYVAKRARWEKAARRGE